MLQSKEATKKIQNKNYLPSLKILNSQPKKLLTYSIGVYFQEKDPFTFEVKAHRLE
jgi:hypothetical protein